MVTNLIRTRIEDEEIQRSLDLIGLLCGSNYRVLEGILAPGQSILIFEGEDESTSRSRRCNVKIVVAKNHWKLETEIA